MFSGIGNASTWVDLFTLILMEIILGVDNLVFISVLVGRAAEKDRKQLTRIGIALSVILRLGLLFLVRQIMGLTAALFTVGGKGFSGRDLILLMGGLFLITKATLEIHAKVEGEHEGEKGQNNAVVSSTKIIAQIVALDLVFSLDSIITAVGMVPPEQLWVMVTAVLISVCVMLAFADPVGRFVAKHASVKVLALAFLVLIGAMLVADGLGQHLPKGYVYFPLAFSVAVEALNLRLKANSAKASGRAVGKDS